MASTPRPGAMSKNTKESERAPRADRVGPSRPTVLVGTLRRDRSAPASAAGSSFRESSRSLREDAREVALNRACGNEEGLRDLAVGEALARELGDPAFTGRQRVGPRENDPRRGAHPWRGASVSAYSASGPAPARWAASSASRVVLALQCAGCVAEAWRRDQHGRGPFSNLASPRSNASMASRSRDAPRSPPATTPAARSATPSARGAPNAWASRSSLQAFRRFVIAEREMGERGVRDGARGRNRRGHHRTRQAFPTPRKCPSPSATRPWPTRSRPRARRRGAAVTIPLSTSESSGAMPAPAAAELALLDERLVAHRRS